MGTITAFPNGLSVEGKRTVYGTLAGLPEDERLTAAQIVARVSTRVPPKRGETIRLAVSPENVHVFSNATQERIS